MYDNFINWLTLKINKLNPIVFVAVVFQIILIIIIVITIFNLIQDQQGTTDNSDNTTPSSHLSITNINQQVPNLPQSGYEEIAFSIYDTAWLNRTNNQDLPTTLAATIREGSTTRQYYEDIDVHQVNFIIELPDLQQSYQVNYLWSKDQYNTNIPTNYKTMVYCPEDATSCTDRYAGTARQIITQSLPH